MAVQPVPVMSPTPTISSIGSSSVISSQIEMMGRKIEQIKAGLSQPSTCFPEEAAAKESDAIDILSHYHYVLTQLMLPAAKRDHRISYFDHDHSLIEVNQESSLHEINACQSLISEIEALGLDLSRARDLISYRAAALDMEEVAHVIEGFIDENRDLVSLLSAQGNSSSLIPTDQYINLNQKLITLHNLREVVSELMQDYQSGFINSFTLDAKQRFLISATKANTLGLDIVRCIDKIVCQEFSKSNEMSLEQRSFVKKNLRELSRNIKLIDDAYILNKGILDPSFGRFSSELQSYHQFSRFVSDEDLDGFSCAGEGASRACRVVKPSRKPMPLYWRDGFATDPFRLDGPYPSLRAIEYHVKHSIAPSELSTMLVHTLNNLGVCLVSPDKLTAGLLDPRDTMSLHQPRVWHVRGSGSDQECRAFFKVGEGGGCEYNEGALTRAACNLMEKLGSLGTPFAALLSAHPSDTSHPRLVLSEPMMSLAPSNMNPSLVGTFAEVGMHLVSPSKLLIATPDPESDTQHSASMEFDNITIAGTFSEGSHYEIRRKTRRPCQEVLEVILEAVKLFMIELQSPGVPAAAILTEGLEDKWISDWLKFESKHFNVRA